MVLTTLSLRFWNYWWHLAKIPRFQLNFLCNPPWVSLSTLQIHRSFARMLTYWPLLYFIQCIPARDYPQGLVTHTYPHKPVRNIKVTICNSPADCKIANIEQDQNCKHRSRIIYDAEYPNQLSLNNTCPRLLWVLAMEFWLLCVEM